MCMRNPCGAGQDMLAISPDGGIYPCEQFVRLPRLVRHKHCMGEVSSETVPRVLTDTWQSGNDGCPANASACLDCVWRAFCGQSCLADTTVARLSEAYNSEQRLFCSYNCALWEGLMWLISRVGIALGRYMNLTTNRKRPRVLVSRTRSQFEDCGCPQTGKRSNRSSQSVVLGDAPSFPQTVHLCMDIYHLSGAELTV